MNRCKKIAAAILLMTASLSFATMRNMTTQEIVIDMGLGINLGNTFEAVIVCNAGDNGCRDWVSSMPTLETTWGSPQITQEMIRGYKAAGFNTVRVPVAWSNNMEGYSPFDDPPRLNSALNYTIDPTLMTRVTQVVDWILAEDMYAIVNIHYDGGWWNFFPTDSTEAMRKFTRIWEQVASNFRTRGDRLVFASLNEEGGWSSIWNIHGATRDDMAAKARSYNLLHAINQQFVNVVRASGGNNGDRHLQVQGYHTDIDRTVDELFQMPTDPRRGDPRIALSVHYYDPFGFTHLAQDEDWEPFRPTWGTPEEVAHLNSQMDKLVDRFVNNGVPIIIGEYGFASTRDRDQAQIRNYTLAVTEAIFVRNMAPVLWDIQLDTSTETWDGQPRVPDRVYYYDRNLALFPDAQLVAGFLEIAAMDRNELNGGGVVICDDNDCEDDIPGSVRNIARRGSANMPSVAVRGQTLRVIVPAAYGNDATVRLIDVRGRVRANFTASNGTTNFNLSRIPAGRYLVEVVGRSASGTGTKNVSSIIVR